MAETEQMTIEERRKYLQVMKKRYSPAGRQERGELLAEMEAVTELHRKSLIRLMAAPSLERQARQKQRGRTYGREVEAVVAVLAETLDYVCAERLHPALGWLADHLQRQGEVEFTLEVREQVERMSVSTLQRMLARQAQDRPRLPRKHPSRGPSATRNVPMKRIPWDEPQPGHLETDLVHHCGPEARGEYVHTLQLVDVATGWSERVAVLGRSERMMQAGFRRIVARLPFPIREIHPDNGSEFFNHHLLRYFREEVVGVSLSRSRPYQKNDNRLVEQKNHTLVRAYFGDARFDTRTHQQLLDQLYDQMWLYYNFFQPVFHLTGKQRRPTLDGTLRFDRSWDQPQTPFQRLCATSVLSEADRAALQAKRDQLNPRRLRRDIYRLCDQLFDLPLATGPEDSWVIPPDNPSETAL